MSNTPTTTHYDVHDEFGNTIGRDTVVTFSPRRPRGWTQWRPGTLMDERTRRIAVEAELAALKARRCDGCQWYACDDNDPDGGECVMVVTRTPDHPRAPAVLFESHPEWHAELLVDADHACNAWTARA